MNETSKSRKIWGSLERSVLTGRGIDIGCGPDPVTPEVRQFDLADGDANHITRHVHEQFDFVYASHCLEHMHDPRQAVLDAAERARAAKADLIVTFGGGSGTDAGKLTIVTTSVWGAESDIKSVTDTAEWKAAASKLKYKTYTAEVLQLVP